MKLQDVLSYQLYICSDYHETLLVNLLAAQTENLVGETSFLVQNHGRLSDRTVYPVRETGVQMRPRARPRPQILPLDQSLQGENRNGLRPARLSRPSRRISRQSPCNQRHFEPNLPDQSRITPPPGEIVEGFCGFAARFNQSRRYRPCRRSCRQHASRLPASEFFHSCW